MKLDLHGIKHEDVRQILDSHIYNNEPPFEIVTGNSLKMKNLVLSVINEYDLGFFYLNTGSVMVIEGQL